MPFHGYMSDYFSGVVDTVYSLQGYSPSISNVPLGSTQIGDQMEAIGWGILGGLPGVGIYATIIGIGLGRDSDWRVTAATMGITSLALYYFMPRTAAAVLEFAMMQMLYGMGLSPHRSGVSPPAWLLLAIMYGYYHSITKEPGAKGTVGMTFGAVPPSQHQGGPVWEHLERTNR